MHKHEHIVHATKWPFENWKITQGVGGNVFILAKRLYHREHSAVRGNDVCCGETRGTDTEGGREREMRAELETTFFFHAKLSI